MNKSYRLLRGKIIPLLALIMGLIAIFYTNIIGSAVIHYYVVKNQKKIASINMVSKDLVSNIKVTRLAGFQKCTESLTLKIPTNYTLAKEAPCLFRNRLVKDKSLFVIDSSQFWQNNVVGAIKVLKSENRSTEFIKKTLSILEGKSTLFEKNLFLFRESKKDIPIFSADKNLLAFYLLGGFALSLTPSENGIIYQELKNYTILKTGQEHNVSYLIFTPHNQVFDFHFNKFSEDEIYSYLKTLISDDVFSDNKIKSN